MKAVGDLEVTQSRAKQPGHRGRGEAKQVRNFGTGVVPELEQRDGRSLPPGGDPERGASNDTAKISTHNVGSAARPSLCRRSDGGGELDPTLRDQPYGRVLLTLTTLGIASPTGLAAPSRRAPSP